MSTLTAEFTMRGEILTRGLRVTAKKSRVGKLSVGKFRETILFGEEGRSIFTRTIGVELTKSSELLMDSSVVASDVRFESKGEFVDEGVWGLLCSWVCCCWVLLCRVFCSDKTWCLVVVVPKHRQL